MFENNQGDRGNGMNGNNGIGWIRDKIKSGDMSYNRFANLINISKSSAYRMIQSGVFPQKKTEEIIKKINELKSKNFEFKKRGKKYIEIKWKGEDRMERITQESLEKFGLNRDPFINEIRGLEDIFILTEQNKAYKYLSDIALYQGFGVLVGEVGSGKTIILQRLLESAKQNIKFIVIKNTDKTKLSAANILSAIYYDLTGKKKGGGHNLEQKTRIVTELMEQTINDDKRICLVIDDAHLVPMQTMRSLKQLYDMVKGFKKLIGIILIGQLEIIQLMGDIRIKEISQRCAFFIMRGLVTPGSIRKYLEFKIKRAGGNIEGIFDEKVYKKIKEKCEYEIRKNGKKIKICPLLRVQNLAGQLMNQAERLGEDKVIAELVD